ncbi:MAG: hypothetical protein GY755_21890 [Chloroflexi bacterium]|nr:hypothetical protein [Chloroflexota bacterium]
MVQEKNTQTSNQNLIKSTEEQEKKPDLDELAKKIVALLLRELDIERERIGK